MSLPTRRHFLGGAVALSCAALPAPCPSLEIISCRCPLSQESRRGYELATRSRNHRGIDLIIAAGLRNVTLSDLAGLRSRVRSGAWLIWERAATFESGDLYEADKRFARVFHFPAAAAQSSHPPSLFVRYMWPTSAMVRRVGRAPMFDAPASSRTIARCCGSPSAFLQSFGHGTVVFLGSMLGPQLSTDAVAANWLASLLDAIAP